MTGTYTALSLGAGVNSTALLHLVVDRSWPLDEVVFADTGAKFASMVCVFRPPPP